jgi:hypothetical protein
MLRREQVPVLSPNNFARRLVQSGKRWQPAGIGRNPEKVAVIAWRRGSPFGQIANTPSRARNATTTDTVPGEHFVAR